MERFSWISREDAETPTRTVRERGSRPEGFATFYRGPKARPTAPAKTKDESGNRIRPAYGLILPMACPILGVNSFDHGFGAGMRAN
jgi:hypothetical protein